MVYQSPNENVLRAVFQKDASLQIADNLKKPGFIFAPFEANGDTVLLTGECQKVEIRHTKLRNQEKKVQFSDVGKDFHIGLVQNAIEQIKKGRLKKVVLSRSIHVATQKQPSLIFRALLSKYPSAFCYWLYHPKIGIWFGATPEQLLQYQNGQVLTTSLAGTLPVQKNEEPNWGSKEQEEQQMVTDYILQNLKGKAMNLHVSGPDTYKAGKLWHLRSVVTGNINSFDALGSVLKRLHPTPAICGLPRESALEYILRHECYQREYYTGYLGPVNLEGRNHANLFVNLRCFKYSSGNAQVFVGGGITADSNPEKEWLETQYKSGTILEVL